MTGTEIVPEKLVIFNQLAWLMVREDFIRSLLHGAMSSLGYITSKDWMIVE
jgi:hypothetical protein